MWIFPNLERLLDLPEGRVDVSPDLRRLLAGEGVLRNRQNIASLLE